MFYGYITSYSPDRILLVSFNLYLYLLLKYSELEMNHVLLRSDILALGREYRVWESSIWIDAYLRIRESCIWIDTYLRIRSKLYLDWYILKNTERVCFWVETDLKNYWSRALFTRLQSLLDWVERVWWGGGRGWLITPYIGGGGGVVVLPPI